jgi:glycosyltransferase involved in cell wall biosynthesis
LAFVRLRGTHVQYRIPRVSVVLPVFNGEAYLAESLGSILAQEMPDLEVIAIDDGSTDATGAILEEHALRDPRVHVHHQTNMGLVAARNRGLALSRARWVALQDHDDASLPMRLSRQLAFLDDHPEVRVLGTYGWRIGARGRRVGVFDMGPRDAAHFAKLRAANEPIYLISSSVVVDRDLAISVGGFRNIPAAEDVDLWTRIADEHLVLALPERLVLYRVLASSISTRRFFTQVASVEAIIRNTARRRAGSPELSMAAIYRELGSEPARRRAIRTLEWRARYFYRRGGALLADGRPDGAAWLAAAFATAPWVPLGRFRRQVVPLLLEARRRR